jgi:hypothetical protein
MRPTKLLVRKDSMRGGEVRLANALVRPASPCLNLPTKDAEEGGKMMMRFLLHNA